MLKRSLIAATLFFSANMAHGATDWQNVQSEAFAARFAIQSMIPSRCIYPERFNRFYKAVKKDGFDTAKLRDKAFLTKIKKEKASLKQWLGTTDEGCAIISKQFPEQYYKGFF
ncbi:hypothetical protein F862_gp091 [Vibrio phage vB_VpaS_MAR10]|uniref:Uncharacterized protein n=1 Tax=Vibrio phage vB_VpaS_MAR10 TaxID=1229755 RepID=K7R9H6_9CAUD|nr:hypothetical protein F862_gp091 [Vibrio phage vB_VpaS_MAR10]AFV81323.1 hypothetical protein MAR10_087 [Vibrio phage vB_VpaS_MAR10]